MAIPKRSQTLPIYQNDTFYLPGGERMRFRALALGAHQLHERLQTPSISPSEGSSPPEHFHHCGDEDDNEDEDGYGGEEDDDPHAHRRDPKPIRQRLRHFTWAWYSLPMSTGGLSVLLFNQPYQFPGLRTIGKTVYVTNIAFFAAITICLAARFALFPGTLKQSVAHRREGFFVPTALLSIATLITSTERYIVSPQQLSDRPDITLVVVVVATIIHASFWAYLGLSIVLAVGQYTLVFSRHRLRPLEEMTPAWFLPIFPVMLTGTIASVIADTQPDVAAVPIIVAGLACQGLGLAVAGMMYALMLGRLFAAGLPDREHRPGLFMCVGPPAFTALALVGMGNGLPSKIDANFDGLTDAPALRTLAVVAAVFLWALSLWWCGIAALAVAMKPPRYFHLGWWAAVFPNSGFTLATMTVGRAMGCGPVLAVATGMSVVVMLTYLFVFVHLVRAVWKQDIMYPERDEDSDDSEL